MNSWHNKNGLNAITLTVVLLMVATLVVAIVMVVHSVSGPRGQITDKLVCVTQEIPGGKVEMCHNTVVVCARIEGEGPFQCFPND